MWSPLRAVGILVLLLFVLAPFGEMVSMALKDPKEQFVIPPTLLPKHLTLENFVDAWNQPNFPRYFLNSLIMSATMSRSRNTSASTSTVGERGS